MRKNSWADLWLAYMDNAASSCAINLYIWHKNGDASRLAWAQHYAKRHNAASLKWFQALKRESSKTS